jgi:hypothetical protein
MPYQGHYKLETTAAISVFVACNFEHLDFEAL